MKFEFNFPVIVADLTIASVPLLVTVTDADEGVSTSGRFKAWTIDSLCVRGPGGEERGVDDDHWIFARAVTHALRTHRSAIDEAWELHCSNREQARRRVLRIVS